jgi:hypothetical protein
MSEPSLPVLPEPPRVPESPEAVRARKVRNWLLAGVLLVFVAIIFAVTIVRLGGNVVHFAQ